MARRPAVALAAALLLLCVARAGSRDAAAVPRDAARAARGGSAADAAAAAAAAAAGGAAAPMWPFDGLASLFHKPAAEEDKEAGLRGLPETPAAAFGSGSLGADAYLAPDLFRGHTRPLIKTKLCLRCTQRVSVKQLAEAAAERACGRRRRSGERRGTMAAPPYTRLQARTSHCRLAPSARAHSCRRAPFLSLSLSRSSRLQARARR
jgi:hypothetical protein